MIELVVFEEMRLIALKCKRAKFRIRCFCGVLCAYVYMYVCVYMCVRVCICVCIVIGG